MRKSVPDGSSLRPPSSLYIYIRHTTQSIRHLITEKINRQEETLTRLIAQRQSAINDHISGRALLTDEGLEYHKTHIAGLRRKLAVTKQKDPAVS